MQPGFAAIANVGTAAERHGSSSPSGHGSGLCPIRRRCRAALQYLAVDDDAGTDPGAENGAEHRLGATTGTVDRLRQRKAVGVVGDAHLRPRRCSSICLTGLPLSTTVLEPRSRPLCGDSDPGVPMPTLQRPATAASHRPPVQQWRRKCFPPSVWGGDAVPPALGAIGVEYHRRGLGAAKIDAEPQRGCGCAANAVTAIPRSIRARRC